VYTAKVSHHSPHASPNFTQGSLHSVAIRRKDENAHV
jgi:hypothetical protein